MLRGSGDGRVMDIDRLRVLVVEDEPLIMTEIALLLEEAGYRVDTASSVQGALSRLAQTRFDAVVLDVELREAIAGDVAEALVRMGTPYAVCSGHVPDGTSIWRAAAAHISKPCSADMLLTTIRVIIVDRF